jgi:hypothetical protein
MGKSSTFDNDLLKLIFNGTNIANIADNTATSPLTNLFVALHTADPGVGGTQSTNEIAYTGYTNRPSVARSGVGWTVTGASVSPAADITFPLMTAGAGGTATYASIGVSATAGTATKILYSGTLTPNITVTNGTTPIIKAGSTIVES